MSIQQVLLLIPCIAVASVTAVLLTIHVRHFVTAIQAERWRSARGRILGSTMSRTAAGWLYWPRVSYEYFVGAHRHTGHQVSAASELPVFINAEDRVQRYPPGRDVTVYYDPEDEDQAVLERTGAMTINVYMIGLTALFLTAMYAIWYVVRM